MYLYLKNENIEIRKFLSEDIEKKIEWINNPANNKYLHYALPLEYEKTLAWYEKIKYNDNRIDATILYSGIPVGLIGLIGIDYTNKKAEYYICMGEETYKGKGIAGIASKMFIEYAFDELKLNKVYLYTEEDNIIAQKLFEKIGFSKEGLLVSDLIYNGREVNRYVYGIVKKGYKNE